MALNEASWVGVTSSNLKRVLFVPNTLLEGVGTLSIEFQKGDVYSYDNVPMELYKNLLAAPSAGNYFNTFIKPFFRTTKIEVKGGEVPLTALKGFWEYRSWHSTFDERQFKQIVFSRIYARDFAHGADSHNNMLIIAKLADLLDAQE